MRGGGADALAAETMGRLAQTAVALVANAKRSPTATDAANAAAVTSATTVLRLWAAL
jgi:hypothetical protein